MSPLFYGVLKKSTHTSPQGVVVTPLNLAFTRQSRLISVKFRTTKWDCLKNQKHKPLYLWDSIKTWDSISLQYLPFWNQRLWHILLIQAIRRSQKRPGTCQVLRLMPLILAQVRQRQVHFCDSGRKIICEFKKKKSGTQCHPDLYDRSWFKTRGIFGKSSLCTPFQSSY